MDNLQLIDFDRYIFSKDGKVWSKHYKKWMYGYLIGDNYRRVNLTLINGKKKDFLLHRVIAYVFCKIPKHLEDTPIEKLEVDHINTDRTDNRAENLRWCNSSENSRNELTLSKNKKNQPKKPVIAISTVSNEIVGTYESTQEASRILGINQGNIYNCASGRCKTTKGYKFQFI